MYLLMNSDCKKELEYFFKIKIKEGIVTLIRIVWN